jgi:hypothetical protein
MQIDLCVRKKNRYRCGGVSDLSVPEANLVSGGASNLRKQMDQMEDTTTASNMSHSGSFCGADEK